MQNKLRQMGNMDRIIKNKVNNEEELFFDIFSIIGQEVLGYVYCEAIEKAENEQTTLVPSNYLKSDPNYYKYVIKRLWFTYNNDKKLKQSINIICGKE